MSPEISVPKRNRRIAVFAGVLLFGTILAGYLAWTRVSAHLVVRWFVEETGLPVEIHSATWDVRWRELLSGGEIRNLNLAFRYLPLNTDVFFSSPVDYTRDAKGHWTIALDPVLKIGDFPEAKGRITIELDVERKGTKATTRGARLDFHLKETSPLALEDPRGRVKVNTWRLDGRFAWDGHWSSQLELSAAGLEAADAESGTVLSAKALGIRPDPEWRESFPFPVWAKTRLAVDGIELRSGQLFIEEPRLVANARLRFDGANVDEARLSIDRPARVRVTGSMVDGTARARFDVKADLHEVFTERAAPWFESQAPLLRRAKAKGSLELKGELTAARTMKPVASGRLKLSAETIEFPSRSLFVDGVTLSTELSLDPEDEHWGRLSIRAAEYQSIKLKDVSVLTRLSPAGIDFTTEDENGTDRPIRQSLWGGSIDIAELYAHIGGDEGTQFTAAVRGGPFELAAVQKDLCLLPQNPLKGSLLIDYPRIVRDSGAFQLVGDTNLAVFNGKAHVGDLHVSFNERYPRLRFDLDWDDLDMRALGEWTKLGDIRGSVHGSLTKTNFVLRPEGPVPHSYDFELRGSARGGKKMSFYGRAVDNILQLLGTNKSDMPWYAQTAVNIMAAFRNLLPAKAEILGFKAKVDNEWTELSTHDPPEDASTYWCDRKNRYLLCGDGFTIPLNTHGVYPVVMKTSAFHEWLNGRIEFVRQKIQAEKKDVKDNAECTPFWE